MIKSMKKNNPHAEKEINLHFLRTFNGYEKIYKYLEHIHISRSSNPAITEEYKKYLEQLFNSNLNACVANVGNYFNNKTYNAIICAPSSTQMHKPFYDSIINGTGVKHSYEFEKTTSAGASKKFCEYYQHFEIKKPFIPIDSPLKKILIVDDMYARGYTTAAIINKLEENNIIVEIIDVFAPLIKG